MWGALVVVVALAAPGCKFRALAVDAAIDAPPPYCDANDPTLVACYELEGTTTDASPNRLDATMDNVTFVVGHTGLAGHIDASTAMNVAESPALDVTAITMEAWIRPSQIPITGTRAGIIDNQGQYGFFLHPNGDLQCLGLQVAANVQPNVWTHVACTYDGTTSLYAGGALLGQTAGGGGPLGAGGTTGISLGADNPPGAGSPLLGDLDQLRIFRVARPAATICTDAEQLACS